MDEKYLEALSKMTYGIYVLTSSYEDRINGMIASWVSQVSYNPLLIMVGIHPNRYSHYLIENSSAFALHVVSKTQKELLGRFKGPDPAAKFKSVEWKRGKTNSPILKECMAFMDCNVISSSKPGNHTLFIGEVVDADVFFNDTPLSTLDYAGTYVGDA